MSDDALAALREEFTEVDADSDELRARARATARELAGGEAYFRLVSRR